MKNKSLFILFLFFLAGCFIAASGVLRRPAFPRPSPFMLQEEYAHRLEEKLLNLLEPAVGVGNVRASVQAKITHQNITKKSYNPRTLTETQIHESGPVLVGQSVSVLINNKDKRKFSSYKSLIEAAVGYDSKRGDRLSIELLPFVKVPLWTLGLSPIVLVRIGICLILVILLGCFFLIREWIKTRSFKKQLVYSSDKMLWQEVSYLSAQELILFLQKKRPEITAFILYCLPQEKAAEVISLLPKNLVNQVILHLSYIEKLNTSDKSDLLYKAEAEIRSFFKNRSLGDLDVLVKWSDNEIQDLLHYVSKKDLTKALQTTSLVIQNLFERNVPPTLWQELVKQSKNQPCSFEESQQAQRKIIRLAHLLKENT